MSKNNITNKLSIVIPLYKSEKNLPLVYNALSTEIFPHLPDYELILVDDGSPDDSYNEAKKLHEQNEKIKVIKLSRNFGQQAAILAGFAHISGNCVVAIAADLQDPISLILEMFTRWLNGEKIIFTARKKREEKFIDKFFISFAAKFNKFISKDIPSGGIGFPLIDARIAQQLIHMDERNSAIEYQLLWMGYHKDFILFDRPKRKIGTSGWTFTKKLKIFIDCILSFSYFPIRLISAIGLIDCILSLSYATYVICQKIFLNVSAGWSSLMVAIMFSSGVQMLTLGIIGEYLWRNFDASRKRPIYLVDSVLGFSNDKNK